MERRLTITVAEAAKRMGIDKNTVYGLARTEGFPSVFIDRRILILPDELEEWLRQQAGLGKGI